MSFLLVSCGNNDNDIASTQTEESGSVESTIEPIQPDEILETFTLEAWADNWFAAYLDEELIVEDSVSINTERSFNSETAEFSTPYPLRLNVILKDFKENDTGLEYIGTNRQQMGDGGFIMQIKDSSGKLIAITDDSWKCSVIHNAPVDTSCESSNNPQEWVGECTSESLPEPTGWKSADFDDSSWEYATVHSATDVDPKIGYDDIDWHPSAKLIWWPDLETNNTILCRVTIEW